MYTYNKANDIALFLMPPTWHSEKNKVGSQRSQRSTNFWGAGGSWTPAGDIGGGRVGKPSHIENDIFIYTCIYIYILLHRTYRIDHFDGAALVLLVLLTARC